MKILVFNWEDIRNPQGGGAEVHLHEVFTRIARLGHEVTLLCSAFPGAPPEEELNGIRVIRRGGRYLFNFRAFWSYVTRFRREGFDVVVDDMNKIPFFTPLYVRRTLVGITHHLFGRSIFREVSFPVAAYVFVMESLAVQLYRRLRVPFIVGSPSTYHELLASGFAATDVTLINYAVDHTLHHPAETRKNPTPFIGYFGRLKRYKSIDHLLRALPRVIDRFPDLRVSIVGEGDDRSRLEAISRELKVEGHVTFTGFVTEERKVELLRQMWVKIATSSKEGWGLTVLEANACGTPVIASDVPGLRDAVKHGETGLLYPYGDIEKLAAAIITVLGDQALRERLRGSALRWAAEFSWDKAAQRTLEVIETVRRSDSASVR